MINSECAPATATDVKAETRKAAAFATAANRTELTTESVNAGATTYPRAGVEVDHLAVCALAGLS